MAREDTPEAFAMAFVAELHARPGRPPSMKRIARRLRIPPRKLNARATQLRRELLVQFGFVLQDDVYVLAPPPEPQQEEPSN